MSRPRFVVECHWNGYRSGHGFDCHRTVETSPVKVDRLRRVHSVLFTDNTTMSVNVRPAKPRERVEEIHGYDQLLDKIVRLGLTGVVRIADLPTGGDS